MPIEYLVFMLSEKWHCPPSEVRKQSTLDFVTTLACMSAEAKVEKANARR